MSIHRVVHIVLPMQVGNQQEGKVWNFFKIHNRAPFHNFGQDLIFCLPLGRYHNSEASTNDNVPRLSTAHSPLFLQSDIMGIKGLPRELPVGGVVRFERDGQYRGERHHRGCVRPTLRCPYVGVGCGEGVG